MTLTAKSFLCLVLLLGIFVADAAAANAKKKTPDPTRGKVIAVDPKSLTLTIQAAPGADPQKCVLNDFSTIEINNKTSTPKQLKAGLWIRSVRLDSSTPPVVEDLDLTTAAN